MEEVRNNARMLAQRARLFKHDVEMDPMSSYERLVVHELFSDDPEIKNRIAGRRKVPPHRTEIQNLSASLLREPCLTGRQADAPKRPVAFFNKEQIVIVRRDCKADDVGVLTPVGPAGRGNNLAFSRRNIKREQRVGSGGRALVP